MTFINTLSSLSPIGKCVCLKYKKRNKEAFELLKKIELLVKPIMISRGWKVNTLAEFFPKNSSLLGLNINKGFKIYIRLRVHNDENTFYLLDYLIEIMLHELVHNNLLNELNSEFNQLLSCKSYNKNFYSSDYKLDKEISNISSSHHGLRLGGSNNSENKTLRDLIREATEKRIEKLKWCGSNSIVIENEEVLEIPEEETLFEKSLQTSSNFQDSSKEKTETSKSKSIQEDIVLREWYCSSCTFKNNASYLQCEMCLSERTFTEFFNKKWKCALCSYINEQQQCSCEFCNTIRVS